MRVVARSLLLVAVAACSTTPASVDGGRETGACIDGACFEGLECLSELCVGPEGGSTSAGTSGTGSGSATTPGGGSANSGETTPSPTDPSAASQDPTTASQSEGEAGSESGGTTTDTTGSCDADILVVVDNSASMQFSQSKVLAATSELVDALEDAFAGQSVHVGVIASDAYVGNMDGCTMLGGLVTETGAGGVCGPFAGGDRFATEDDDLDAALTCMVQVGTGGSAIEQPITGAIAALENPASCNDNFLRDDAVLGIFIVSDDLPFDTDLDDAHPDADVSEWHDAVLAAKGGDETSVAVTGIIPAIDVSCSLLQAENPNFIEFVEDFGPRGLIASVCNKDYGPSFAQGVELLADACASR